MKEKVTLSHINTRESPSVSPIYHSMFLSFYVCVCGNMMKVSFIVHFGHRHAWQVSFSYSNHLGWRPSIRMSTHWHPVLSDENNTSLYCRFLIDK